MAQDKKILVSVGSVVLCALLVLLLAAAFPEEQEEVEVPLGRGVVVESVKEGSALDGAGLRPGDVLLRWKRLSGTSGNFPALGGRTTIFDWYLFVLDQVPRGPLTLTVSRAGHVMTVEGVSLEQLSARKFWLGGFAPVTSELIRMQIKKSSRLYEAGDPTNAARILRSLGHRERTGGWTVECWLLLRRASLWLAAGAPRKALELLQQAQSSAEAPAARLAVLRLSAKAHQAAGDLQASEAALLESLELQESAWTEGVHLASTVGRIGLLSWYRGDLDRAETYLRRAASNAERFAPESIVHAAWVANLGLILEAQGDLAAAVAHQQDALELQRRITPVHPNIARGLINLGSLDLRRGHLMQATDRYRRALEMVRVLEPDSELEAACLGNLGSVELARGDLDLAAKYAFHSHRLWQKIAPESRDAALSLDRLADIYRRQGEYDRAEESLRGALEIHRALSTASIDVADSLEALGSLSRDRGNPSAARDFFEQALQIRQQNTPENLAVAVSLNRLGYLELEQDQPDVAETHYRKALEIFERLEIESVDVAETLLGLGWVSRAEGDLQAAHLYWARAIEVLQAQMRNLGGPSYLKASYRNKHGSAYRAFVELLLDMGQKGKAFEVQERARAIEFLELLQRRDLDFQRDVPAPLEASRRRLATVYDQILRNLAAIDPGRQPDRHAMLQSQLWQTWRGLEEVSEEIQRQSPDVASLQYPHPRELTVVQRALDPGTVILSYSVGEDRTDLLIVTQERFEGVTLPIGESELRHRVTDFREIILRAIPGDQTGARQSLDLLGRNLYQVLLAPVEEFVAAHERILILPDGPLHLLPWAVLIRDSGRFLVEWKPVHLAVSATVYAELRQDRPKFEKGSGRLQLAAFGDPRYSDQIEEGQTQTLADVHVRSAVERGLFDWQRLAHSREEVESIASLYPSGEVQTYLGAEATEEAVKSLTGLGESETLAPRIVHFATHGHLDDQFPLNSALVLSIPEEFEEGRDNGLLQVWEIFERVRLDADLVVLSACSSALGEELGGEGLIGLTRAFQYAGARSVVASLWNVRDQATSELMLRFYSHLRSGLPKDEALRAAQVELIQGPVNGKDLSAPFYWAAFQTYGDWK